MTPAGPTLKDVVANVGVFVGLLHGLAKEEKPLETLISFSDARENLYQAAQEGLAAKLKWVDGKTIPVSELLIKKLIPIAMEGLKGLQLRQEDIDEYIHGIIIPRIRSGQNGAQWQRKAAKKFKGNLKEMTAAYLEHQRIGNPVHEWSI